VTDSLWQDPPESLDAPVGVDLWLCALDREGKEQSDCARLLDPEERARAARFVFDHDRRRWTVAHGLLRKVLGRYVRRSPEELRFETDPWGKPSLRDHPSLAFNVSHSGPLMLIAVAAGRPVGIDLEQIRTDIDAAGIADRFLSPGERAALAAVPAELLPAAFFTCWT
jgi:4'-phosphopantetheinyl transferase